MANPPFQVEGPPYPTKLPFYQTEALSWLLNNRERHCIANVWTPEKAIETVKKLYSSGAIRVEVVVTLVGSQGKDWADELEVTFPKDRVDEILEIIKPLKPDNWEMDLGEGETMSSRYLRYAREVREDAAATQTMTLWWD